MPFHPQFLALADSESSRRFAVLHWPAGELAELISAYPGLAAEYPSHEEHLATIEASLRELASSGTPKLRIGTLSQRKAMRPSASAEWYCGESSHSSLRGVRHTTSASRVRCARASKAGQLSKRPGIEDSQS